MRWVTLFSALLLFCTGSYAQFSVIKILQKSKYTFFVLQCMYVRTYAHVYVFRLSLSSNSSAYVYSIYTYIVFIFIYTIWLDFVILLTCSPSRSISHLLCAFDVCALVCLYGVFYFFVSLFFAIDGPTCAKSNIAKDSICTFVHAFVRSFVQSLVYFDLIESKKRWCKMA